MSSFGRDSQILIKQQTSSDVDVIAVGSAQAKRESASPISATPEQKSGSRTANKPIDDFNSTSRIRLLRDGLWPPIAASKNDSRRRCEKKQASNSLLFLFFSARSFWKVESEASEWGHDRKRFWWLRCLQFNSRLHVSPQTQTELAVRLGSRLNVTSSNLVVQSHVFIDTR